MLHAFEREIGGRMLRLETGKLAGKANGAVTVRYGDTLVLVTAVAAKPREGIDFFPLTVDYEERLYAAGKIPGSFFRREGRPTTEAILTMRLVDRPLRPMFPKGMRNDVQVIITTLSTDRENAPDILGIIGASAALSISDIPFETISGTRIGYANGRLIVNPTLAEAQNGDLDLTVAGTKNAVVMVEAGAKEVSEELMMQAMKMAQIANGEVVELIEEMRRTVGKPKFALPVKEPPSPEIEAAVQTTVGDKIEQALRRPGLKADREEALDSIRADTLGKLMGQFPEDKVASAYETKLKAVVRHSILHEGLRPDGRKLDEIRPITCEVGVLPRTHGSGLFTRGETQALTIATLGSMGDKQKIDGIGIEETKRYIHHYNFPPYSTGEIKRMGGSGRREIGHGALAERALEPVIPTEEEFPYTLRLVSEILGSNGSSSMASVCGSTLALLDAGVPLKKPVAGVAMGLVKGAGNEFAVLTDIQGLEDALGDIDFKVAGTADGITALQMDMKVTGISMEVLAKALEQAKHGRIFVLDKLIETISHARPELSKYAPRMIRIKINPEKIGAVIGPGGKTIRGIIEQTKASVDVEDDGTVFIGATSQENAQRAIKIIEGLTKDIEIGEVYTGKVVRLMNFGAFVEILPGKDGLVHVSELSDQRVNNVEDVVKVGDELTVMVTEVDRMGRINLSRRAVLEGLGQGGARVRDTLADSDGAPRAEGSSQGERSGPPRYDRGGGGGRGPGGPPRFGGGRAGPPRR